MFDGVHPAACLLRLQAVQQQTLILTVDLHNTTHGILYLILTVDLHNTTHGILYLILTVDLHNTTHGILYLILTVDLNNSAIGSWNTVLNTYSGSEQHSIMGS